MKYVSQRQEVIRSYSTGIGKTAVIYPTAFLVALSSGGVSLGVIFYARDVFQAAPVTIGLLSALWSLSYILGCLFVRPLFDHILPRHLLIASTFLMSLSSALMLVVKALPALAVLYGFFGLALSFFWPPLMGWLAGGMEGEPLGKLMSRFNFSWSAGIIASPYLTGYLSEINPRHPLEAGGALLFITCVMITGASLALPGIRQDTDTGNGTEGESPGEGRGTLLRYPAWVGLFTCFVAIGVILNIFPVAAREEFGMAKGTIGLLLEGRIVAVTVGFVIMGRTSFWHFRPAPMLACQGILALALAGLIFVRGRFPMGALIACVGFCMGVSYFYSQFHGISGSGRRTARVALHESLLSAGLISGSSMGGFIYQHFSIAWVYGCCAALVILGLAAQGVLSARSLRREGGSRGSG